MIWRVVWNLQGTDGPQQSAEFTSKDKAFKWADGLLAGGANAIIVTELIVGKTVRVDDNLFTIT
jgi:hypothetical protein